MPRLVVGGRSGQNLLRWSTACRAFRLIESVRFQNLHLPGAFALTNSLPGPEEGLPESNDRVSDPENLADRVGERQPGRLRGRSRVAVSGASSGNQRATKKAVKQSNSGDGFGGAGPIRVRGCRVHNLQSIDVDVPRGRLVVLCGLSGSGKTSLALDTLYAEGQRCYIESFSAYTRQYLQRLDKPDCDQISGIPPAIAVTRASAVKTNRSTVGTATEIAEHARLLYAKVSQLTCYGCGRAVEVDDPQVAAEQLQATSRRALVGFEVWLPDRKAASEILLGLQQEGYLRLVLKEITFKLSDEDRSAMARRIGSRGVSALVVVDRLTAQSDLSRWTESLESAMREGNGRAVVLFQGDTSETRQAVEPGHVVDGQKYHRRIISDRRRCDECDIEYPEPVPRLFNFNHPLGACPKCEGFGDIIGIDMNRVVPDPSKSIREGAIAPWNSPSYAHELEELLALAGDYQLPVDVPFSELKRKHLQLIHRGVPERHFGGLDGFFAWLDRKKYKMHIRVFAARYRSYRRCPTCDGKRLRPEALAYRLAGRDIAAFLSMRCDQVEELLADWVDGRLAGGGEEEAAGGEESNTRRRALAAEPVRQIRDRLDYLDAVGLGYLELDRTLRTLSAGEAQRIALTSALGSTLVGMLYVLDEPTAGLHSEDVRRLSRAIERLRDRGNTVVVVEHNEQILRLADRILEIGPGAGAAGGRLTFDGNLEELVADAESVTGSYLRPSGTTVPKSRKVRQPTGVIELRGASGRNLQSIDVDFPLGVLCAVTGRSGSGKSTLIHDTFYGGVRQRLRQQRDPSARDAGGSTPLPFAALRGVHQIKDCLLVDQSPISRSPRSCPVTFAKAFDGIRAAFAETVDASIRNFKAGHFSFNSAAGQCAACEGAGVQTVDMQFLADVTMRCPECRGRRYRSEVLQVRYRDRTIAEVLEMTVGEASEFFRGHAKVQARLQRLIDVGLDYVALGQPATTLSSGEAQRLKLAAFLAGSGQKPTLFLMDEPTTGLHFADVTRLIGCFDALIAEGHSLVVIEHHPMLIGAADYVIDIGPGAAEEGGRVVSAGPAGG